MIGLERRGIRYDGKTDELDIDCDAVGRCGLVNGIDADVGRYDDGAEGGGLRSGGSIGEASRRRSVERRLCGWIYQG